MSSVDDSEVKYIKDKFSKSKDILKIKQTAKSDTYRKNRSQRRKET